MENLENFKKVLLPTTRREIIIKSASGFYVEAIIKNRKMRLIDASSQIGTNVLGFRNPEILEAVNEYFKKGNNPILMAGNDYYFPHQKELAEKFTEIYPQNLKIGDLKVYYCNSGSEAVERGCLKAAELYGRANSFIAFTGAFHGRTSLALSANFSKGEHKSGFNFLARVLPAPYSQCLKCCTGKKCGNEDCYLDSIAYVEHLIEREGFVNAVIAEPVQGEGGYVFPHKKFFPELYKVCRQNNIPLIVDEIQSAIRTGHWFAIENYKTSCDMISIAKAFSGGICAFGAALIKNKFATKEKNKHSSTFGGSPFQCFVALKTIEIIEKNNYLENARKLGEIIGKRLNELNGFGIVKEIRGLGLMWGIEFQKKGRADYKVRDEILKELIRKGVLTEKCGNDKINPSIRLLLPVNINLETVEKVLDALENSIKKFSQCPEYYS